MDFEKAVKIRLVEMGKTQRWLIEQVRERTGGYFDSSYLWRLLHEKTPGKTGKGENRGKLAVICEILELPMEAENPQ